MVHLCGYESYRKTNQQRTYKNVNINIVLPNIACNQGNKGQFFQTKFMTNLISYINSPIEIRNCMREPYDPSNEPFDCSVFIYKFLLGLKFI